MKKYSLVVLFLMVFVVSKAQDYSIESEIYECYSGIVQNGGFDLTKEIEKYEAYLIKEGILKNKSGKSYYNVYKKIAKQGVDWIKLESSFPDFFRGRGGNNDVNSDCLEELKELEVTAAYEGSRLYRIQSMQKEQVTKDVKSAAAILIKVLAPQDFKHNFYKVTFMVLLYNIQTIGEGIKEKLPPKSSTLKKRNIISVEIPITNKIKFDGKEIGVEELKLALKKVLLNEESHYNMPELKKVHIDLIGECKQTQLIIQLNMEGDTSYDTYLKVTNAIQEAYKEARDEKALKVFGKKYAELTEAQRKAIKTWLPKRITEGRID